MIVARGWSAEEKQAYRPADNELAARGSWDLDLLRSELGDLKFSGFDLDLIGFEPDRLDEILAGLGSSGLSDPDSVPDVPEQPVTRPGDVSRLGDHRVGCGDSTNAANVEPVLAGAQPHLMVSDPLMGSAMIRPGERAGGSVPASSRKARCSTMTAPIGARPMRCLPGMSLMCGTGRCTAMWSAAI